MECYMRKVTFGATLFVVLVAAGVASAQGTVRGAQDGAEAGGQAAGPVGAVVGGAVGAATGTVGGILGVTPTPAPVRARPQVLAAHLRDQKIPREKSKRQSHTQPAASNRVPLRRSAPGQLERTIL